MKSDTGRKAWLNYNCSQGNNWITLFKFDEIINHKNRQLFKVVGNGNAIPSSEPMIITSRDLSHIYFTYMTEELIKTLVETYDGQLYFIHNRVNVIEKDNEADATAPVPAPQEQTIVLTNEVIDQKLAKKDNGSLKKVTDTVELPEIESYESKIYHLQNVSQLRGILSKNERHLIGIRDKDWLQGELKKVQRTELSKCSFMDFINLPHEADRVKLFDQYAEQSGELLNLTHMYTITPALLGQIQIHSKVNQIVLYQNFQIDDFAWFSKFPNLKLLNIFYCHQIEQKHIEQMVQVVPGLEVLNIHSCTRINVRVLIPIFKLSKLSKLCIDDLQFWCQKGVFELFIFPDEWKQMKCPSLQQIAINSQNLTMDVIDYILLSCPNIKQFIVDDATLKLLLKNVVNGYDTDDIMSFHSWQDPSKGCEVRKKITFKNLMKDNYNAEPFSDSMLKKIKEIREKRGEKEQTPIIDQPKSKP